MGNEYTKKDLTLSVSAEAEVKAVVNNNILNYGKNDYSVADATFVDTTKDMHHRSQQLLKRMLWVIIPGVMMVVYNNDNLKASYQRHQCCKIPAAPKIRQREGYQGERYFHRH